MKRVLGFLGVVLLCAFLGLLPGYLIASMENSGTFVKWRTVPLPEGVKAQEFVIGEGFIAYVKTTSGELYMHECESRESVVAWEPVTEVITQVSGSGLSSGECVVHVVDTDTGLFKRNPPGNVASRINCTHNREWGATFCDYVILENGETLTWSFFSGLDGLLRIFQYAIYSAIISALIGVIVFARLLPQNDR
ncbi:MAG TPA: hypothetical protein PKH77_20910 [Anaerolineae bacterium]|nr:hypothetical protein [Anaerolineae bacterium]